MSSGSGYLVRGNWGVQFGFVVRGICCGAVRDSGFGVSGSGLPSSAVRVRGSAYLAPSTLGPRPTYTMFPNSIEITNQYVNYT